jgi:hypothetical protein
MTSVFVNVKVIKRLLHLKTNFSKFNLFEHIKKILFIEKANSLRGIFIFWSQIVFNEVFGVEKCYLWFQSDYGVGVYCLNNNCSSFDCFEILSILTQLFEINFSNFHD